MAEPPKPKAQHAREAFVVGLLAASGVLVAVGAVLEIRPQLPFSSTAHSLLLVGVAGLAAAQVASFEIGTLRWVVRGETSGTRYEQLRRWTRLKVGVLLLTLLLIWSTIVLLAAVTSRFDLVQIQMQGSDLRRVLSLQIAAIALVAIYTHYQSLRVQLEQDRGGLRRAYNLLGSLIGAAGAAAATMVAVRGRFFNLEEQDGLFLNLFALVALGMTLFVTRSLPTPYGIFGEDKRYHGHVHFSRSKSVALPTFIAFSLLFVLLLLFLVVGFGVTERVSVVFRSTLVLVMIGVLVAAGILSFAASLLLASREDKPVLFQRKKSSEEKAADAILWGSVAVAAVLFLAAFFIARRPMWGFEKEAWLHFFTFGILVLVGPVGFYKADRARRVRRIEERFPDFLRDLASSHKGGLTMPAAVFVAAKGDYGSLTPDIQKFADQLSWNVSFDEALQRFGERVHTPVVARTVSLILAASRSGGNTTDVLLAAGRDAREIKQLEAQRRLSMSLYTAVIYITFAVFLVVVAIMSVRFVPQIIGASEAALEQGATGVGGISFNTPSEQQFRTFYYLAAVVQGAGDGIVAGMMGSGRFSLGLRHSFLMVLIAYLTFTFWL